MFDDLSLIIDGRVEESRHAAIMSLAEALEKHKATGWKDLLLRRHVNNEEDASTLVDHAVGVLIMQVEALFQQMKIKVDLENIPLEMLSEIIEALLFAPSDDDKAILSACIEAEDSVEGFCNVLGIKLNRPSEDFMEYVLGVSEATLMAVSEVVQRSSEDMDTQVVANEKILGDVNRYQLVAKDTVFAMEALGEGVRPGTSSEALVETYLKHADLSDPERVVDDIVSMVLLAGTDEEALIDEVCHYLEQVYPDLFDMQRARKILTKKLTAFEEAK